MKYLNYESNKKNNFWFTNAQMTRTAPYALLKYKKEKKLRISKELEERAAAIQSEYLEEGTGMRSQPSGSGTTSNRQPPTELYFSDSSESD